MISNKILTAAEEVNGPIVVPRDHIVNAGVQYGAGGLGTLVLEGTLNEVDWVAIGLTPAGGGAVVASVAAAGIWYAAVSQYSSVRLRKSVAGGGPVTSSLSIASAR